MLGTNHELQSLSTMGGWWVGSSYKNDSSASLRSYAIALCQWEFTSVYTSYSLALPALW